MRIACELGLNREDTRKLLLSLEFPSGGLPAADALLEELDQLFSSPRVSSELKAQLAVVVSSALQTWKEVQTKKVRWAVIPVAGWHARLSLLERQHSWYAERSLRLEHVQSIGL